MEGSSESHGKILAHDSRKPAQAGTSGEYTSETEDESMMNLKIGKRIEIEYERVLRRAEQIRSYWEEHDRTRQAEGRARPARAGQEALRAKLGAWKKRLSRES